MTRSADVRVLLVDDDEEEYFLTQELLTDLPNARVRVDWASTFDEGLERIRRCEHDLYLVDYRLGSRDGIELMERGQQYCPHSGYIVLTGYGDEAVDELAMKRGALDYLPKQSINGEILRRAIFHALQRKRAEQALRRQREISELLREVVTAANDARTTQAALQRCLSVVCLKAGWTVGHAYLLDEAESPALTSARVWYPENPGEFAELRRCSESFRFNPGVGKIGEVWASGAPVWVTDVYQDKSFLRAELSADLGVKAMLAAPILVRSEVVGVVELFSTEAQDPDRELLQAMQQVGTELGRVVERERALASMRQNETQLLQVLESLGDAVVMLDASGEVFFANAAAKAYLPPGDAPPEAPGSLHLDDTLPGVLRELVSGSRRERDHECVVRMPSGQETVVAIRIRPVRDGSGGRFVASLRDVTAIRRIENRRRELENELRQAQKMEAIGRIAAGIAHDFNNVLSVIVTTSAFLSEVVAGDPRASEDVDSIRRAAKRASRLVKQLLTFSRSQPEEPTPVDLNEVIYESERILKKLVGEDVRLETKCADSLEAFEADRGHVEQLLFNLIVNARDAIPARGTVTIETSMVPVDENRARSTEGLEPGDYVLLKVTDTGAGIDESIRDKVFDPFFTTKQMGSGTGLGLSIVYGVVKQCGGHIEFDSVVGLGTTFFVYFPSIGERASVLTKPPEPAHVGGTERILLVEDEEIVRRAAARILRAAGYQVFEAASAAEALSLFAGDAKDADLVVTDVIMPDKGGAALARELGAANPGIKVLFMSGYSEDEVLANPSGAGFLPKPFSHESLLGKVRAMLDAQRSGH